MILYVIYLIWICSLNRFSFLPWSKFFNFLSKFVLKFTYVHKNTITLLLNSLLLHSIQLLKFTFILWIFTVVPYKNTAYFKYTYCFLLLLFYNKCFLLFSTVNFELTSSLSDILQTTFQWKKYGIVLLHHL